MSLPLRNEVAGSERSSTPQIIAATGTWLAIEEKLEAAL